MHFKNGTNGKFYGRGNEMNECEKCKLKSQISGQAFTTYVCENCEERCMHPNTCTPRICRQCSEELNICRRCLKELGK